MPYYNRDPKRDHNFHNHPFVDVCRRICCSSMVFRIHELGRLLSWRCMRAGNVPSAAEASRSFPKIRIPQYRPQYTIALIIGTPKRVPLILGNPPLVPMPTSCSGPMTKFNTHVEKIRPLPDGSGCLLAWFRGYREVILGLYGDNGKEHGN